MALVTTVSISAERRTATGKGVARQLRMNGRIPAVVYGRRRNSEALSLSLADFEKTMVGVSGNAIIDLDVEGTPTKVLVREIQRHPFRPGILHIDFYEIHEGVTLTVDVPIHLEGIPVGVKADGGVLDQVMRGLEIEVLPQNIPARIEVDVSNLTIGQSIHVSDLEVPNATILDDLKATVCTVAAPRVEEEVVAAPEEAEAEEGAEPELIRKPKEEGEGEDESESGSDG